MRKPSSKRDLRVRRRPRRRGGDGHFGRLARTEEPIVGLNRPISTPLSPLTGALAGRDAELTGQLHGRQRALRRRRFGSRRVFNFRPGRGHGLALLHPLDALRSQTSERSSTWGPRCVLRDGTLGARGGHLARAAKRRDPHSRGRPGQIVVARVPRAGVHDTHTRVGRAARHQGQLGPARASRTRRLAARRAGNFIDVEVERDSSSRCAEAGPLSACANDALAKAVDGTRIQFVAIVIERENDLIRMKARDASHLFVGHACESASYVLIQEGVHDRALRLRARPFEQACRCSRTSRDRHRSFSLAT